MKILLLLIIFFLVGAFFIVSENSLYLKEQEDRNEFGELFLSWTDKIFDNSKNLAGYIVKLDWLPEREG